MRFIAASIAFFLALVLHGAAETIFQDYFESGVQGPQWTMTATNQGRTRITTEHGPATGNYHLVLDDSVEDNVFSAAEAVITLDLRNKKNVVLTFKVKSLGNEPHAPPGNVYFSSSSDAVSINNDVDGSSRRSVQSLATVTPEWTLYTVELDATAFLFGPYGQDFHIRFSAYDNSPAPADGIAIDDIVVTADPDRPVILQLPNELIEGTGPHTGRFFMPVPLEAPVTVALSTVPGDSVTLPASVTIPAGETYVDFEFSIPDDALVNFSRTVSVVPSAANTRAFRGFIRIHDDEEPPVATLTLPEKVFEGSDPAPNARISLSKPADVDVGYQFSAAPSAQLEIFGGAIPAGQTERIFVVRARDDSLLDGDVSVTVTGTHFALATVTATTIAVDNDVPTLSVSLPLSTVEGASGIGTVSLNGPQISDVSVALASSAANTLAVPASVTITAGQISATFTYTTVNDTLVNFSRNVTVTATSQGITAGSTTVAVTDNETPPVLVLKIPASLAEGQSPAPTGNGSIAITKAVTVPMTVSLSSSPASQLSLFPSSVTFSPGQTVALITVAAVNDTLIDGNVPVTVTATTALLPASSVQTTTVVDNESNALTLTLPSPVHEGTPRSASVSISGTLASPLVVNLSGADPAVLTAPASVTIAAGQTSRNFTLAATDNIERDGTRSASLTASAPGFQSASRDTVVRDNDPVTYRIDRLTDIVNVSAVVPATIAAIDVENNVIGNFNGTVNLFAMNGNGTSQPLTPSSVQITGLNGWSGNLTLPPEVNGPLRIRVSDAGGIVGDSVPLDVMRVVDVPATDCVWDHVRGRIFASVAAGAGGAHANRVVAIDPATGTITGSIVSNQNPGKLAITSGCEYIYAAQADNKTIARIDPAAMSIVSSFAVGTGTSGEVLLASDLCTVAGQPNLVVVAQKNSFSATSVAVFDNGVMRPNVTQIYFAGCEIETSSDPTLIFGGSASLEMRKLRVNSSGIQEVAVHPKGILDSFNGFRSAGDRVFSRRGWQGDGMAMSPLGNFSLISNDSAFCGDTAARRAYYLESPSLPGSLDIYDFDTLNRIRALTMPGTFLFPRNMVRWGPNGLACIFGSTTKLAIMSGSRIVPTEPPADLRVSVEAPANVTPGAPFTYTIHVANDGPNPARDAQVFCDFSDFQILGNVTSSAGSVAIATQPLHGRPSVTVVVPEIAAGAGLTLTVAATALAVPSTSLSSVSCTATVTSNAIQLSAQNASTLKIVPVGYQSAPDRASAIRLATNNLIYDPTRDILWATIPAGAAGPLARSLVTIDPRTGSISSPIPLGAPPVGNSLTLSSSGRYLYMGMNDSGGLARIDLSVQPLAITRIPLGQDLIGDPEQAGDIEVLPGDGTSFLFVGRHGTVAVFDDTVRRGEVLRLENIERVEKTNSPGIIVGLSSTGLKRLQVSATGVIFQSFFASVLGGSSEIRGAGSIVLGGNGALINPAFFTLLGTMPIGAPCVDLPNGRVYTFSNSTLNAARSTNAAPEGTFAFTTMSGQNSAETLVRWGLDGFAVATYDGKIHIARWSGTIPPAVDSDGDKISDAWEAAYFGTLASDPAADADGDGIANVLEWLFATSPLAPGASPLTASVTGEGAARKQHLVYPRRAGIPPAAYRYEATSDLGEWAPAVGYTETIVSTQTIGGVSIETVDVAVPFPNSERGFVRIAWPLE